MLSLPVLLPMAHHEFAVAEGTVRMKRYTSMATFDRLSPLGKPDPNPTLGKWPKAKSTKAPNRSRAKRERERMKTLAIGATLALVLATPLFAAPDYATAVLDSLGSPYIELSRPVYPYSVVPGGAANPEDAAARLGQDPEDVTEYRLPHDTAYYASYRWTDGKIYWTTHRLILKAGEAVYRTPTGNYRARCLNGLSAVKMLPTRQVEPTPAAFDQTLNYATPEALPAFVQPIADVLPDLEIPSTVPPEIVNPGHSGNYWWPLVGLGAIPFIHRHHVQPPEVPIIVPPPVVAGVPEPRFLALIVAAVLAMLVLVLMDRQMKD